MFFLPQVDSISQTNHFSIRRDGRQSLLSHVLTFEASFLCFLLSRSMITAQRRAKHDQYEQDHVIILSETNHCISRNHAVFQPVRLHPSWIMPLRIEMIKQILFPSVHEPLDACHSAILILHKKSCFILRYCRRKIFLLFGFYNKYILPQKGAFRHLLHDRKLLLSGMSHNIRYAVSDHFISRIRLSLSLPGNPDTRPGRRFPHPGRY